MDKIKLKKMFLSSLFIGFSFFSHSQNCAKKHPDQTSYISCTDFQRTVCPNTLMLIPRISLIESTNPFPFKNQEEVPKGLLIYNIATTKDLTIGLYSWNGKKWVKCENPTLQEAME